MSCDNMKSPSKIVGLSPFQMSKNNYIPSCISPYNVLPLCKKFIKICQFGRSYANKISVDIQTDSVIPIYPQTLFAEGYN